jgi:hypothetical protein
MLREGTRIMYIADFAIALLAGMGLQYLFDHRADGLEWKKLKRVLLIITAGLSAALLLTAIYAAPGMNTWNQRSIVMIVICYVLFCYVLVAENVRWARMLSVGFILIDVSGFDWTGRNKTQLQERDQYYWQKLSEAAPLARFLKQQPGVFRVHLEGADVPNIGEVWSILTTNGAGATGVFNFMHLQQRQDLLNVEYIVKPASTTDPSPIYEDRRWKVYRNPAAFPHAWMVHQVRVERVQQRIFDLVEAKADDLHQIALVQKPLPELLDPLDPAASESARITAYEPERIHLKVNASGRVLLVTSENFYPGWKATVNGKDADVFEVDGALRAVVVPTGASDVEFRYAPFSIRIGGILTLLSIGFVGFVAISARKR